MEPFRLRLHSSLVWIVAIVLLHGGCDYEPIERSSWGDVGERVALIITNLDYDDQDATTSWEVTVSPQVGRGEIVEAFVDRAIFVGGASGIYVVERRVRVGDSEWTSHLFRVSIR